MGVILLVGRSCSGKTETQKELCRRSRYNKVVTCTTRPKRVGEVDGTHYHFLSKEEFLSKQGLGEFVECTEYVGELYGSLKKDLEGDDIKVMVLEPSEAVAVKNIMGDNALFVSLFVDSDTCYEALRSRGDSEEVIENRMEMDDRLFADVEDFADIVIDNSGFVMSPKEVADAIHRAANTYF